MWNLSLEKRDLESERKRINLLNKDLENQQTKLKREQNRISTLKGQLKVEKQSWTKRLGRRKGRFILGEVRKRIEKWITLRAEAEEILDKITRAKLTEEKGDLLFNE